MLAETVPAATLLAVGLRPVLKSFLDDFVGLKPSFIQESHPDGLRGFPRRRAVGHRD
jgi:hypothetical protein